MPLAATWRFVATNLIPRILRTRPIEGIGVLPANLIISIDEKSILFNWKNQ